MLSNNQWRVINSLVKEMSTAQRNWLSGYLAGIGNGASVQPPVELAAPPAELAAPVDPVAAETLTIVYGSQGGNGKSIATALTAMLQNTAATAPEYRLLSLAQYKTAWLKKEQRLLIIISTHGEGEPPDDAKAFYDFLFSARAPKLPQLKYAVLALGDSSYELFCKTGRDIDERLQTLGAQQLTPLVECDVDYETTAGEWQQTVANILEEKNGNGAGPALPAGASGVITLPEAATNMPTRAHPFTAPIIDNILLTRLPRRTIHLELALEDSGISYQPGDSIGIYPQNTAASVDKVLTALKLTSEQTVTLNAETHTAADWTQKKLDICRPTSAVLRRYCELSGSEALAQLLNDSDKLSRYLNGRDYGDILNDFPPPPERQSDVLACLRRLAPRLYSLASSQQLREDEVHLLISVTEYSGHDHSPRLGVCSHYLSTLQADDTVDIYIQPNESFRLPTDSNKPIIMIGPGTGIAPFRAFMEQREADGGSGNNWLFFGNRHRRDEFYYQTEWQTYRANGLLTRLDVAFSRDGAEKIYVQDKLRQQSAEVWQWLQDDAYLYVCGDSKMATDVHSQLEALISEHSSGGVSGSSYLQQMKNDGRYQRDVY